LTVRTVASICKKCEAENLVDQKARVGQNNINKITCHRFSTRTLQKNYVNHHFAIDVLEANCSLKVQVCQREAKALLQFVRDGDLVNAMRCVFSYSAFNI
jgi:hypothetical protein